jgi:BirA family transcriptional regulator, biotin operon repressor / biotin---[acetyl-CoA-carboxylase] ligase
MELAKSRAVYSQVFWFEQIDSTNLEMGRREPADLQHFSAVIAGSQLAGAGRLGRSWESEAGSSLSLSICLKPNSLLEPNWATLLAALAVSAALRELGLKASIKWPNDVLIEGKKVCGILASLQSDGSLVVGIGVNINSHPSDLDTATSLAEHGIETDLDTLAASIGAGFKDLITEFALDSASVKLNFQTHCITLGQKVRAQLPNGSAITGEAVEVDAAGQLVILTPERISLSAADVWHLRGA